MLPNSDLASCDPLSAFLVQRDINDGEDPIERNLRIFSTSYSTSSLNGGPVHSTGRSFLPAPGSGLAAAVPSVRSMFSLPIASLSALQCSSSSCSSGGSGGSGAAGHAPVARQPLVPALVGAYAVPRPQGDLAALQDNNAPRPQAPRVVVETAALAASLPLHLQPDAGRWSLQGAAGMGYPLAVAAAVSAPAAAPTACQQCCVLPPSGLGLGCGCADGAAAQPCFSMGTMGAPHDGHSGSGSGRQPAAVRRHRKSIASGGVSSGSRGSGGLGHQCDADSVGDTSRPSSFSDHSDDQLAAPARGPLDPAEHSFLNAKLCAGAASTSGFAPADGAQLPCMKQCKLCHQTKGRASFTVNRRRRDGLESACRDCIGQKRGARKASQTVVESKQCGQCGATKPAAAFHADPHTSSGLCRYCRDCILERRRAKRTTVPTVAEKPCSSCHLVKPAAAFTRNTFTRTGLGSWCRECTMTHTRRKRAEHGPAAPGTAGPAPGDVRMEEAAALE